MRRCERIRRALSQKPASRNHFSDCSKKHVEVAHHKHIIDSHNGVISGRMDYVRGWAYQQHLLDRRLQSQREQKNASTSTGLQERTHDDHDVDRILMFEHNHVYTLGRGADEENLTFLDKVHNGKESRRRLSRKNRGPDSCRLGAEIMKAAPSNSTLEEAVRLIDPPKAVYAPNGVPIYRIERGGEVTYHGPGQLVVYPMLNLRKGPFKEDLHWYLRCVEEVIIRVLQEYSITGVRDGINTGVWVNKKKIAAVGLSSARWITTHGFALNIDPDLEMFDTSIIIPCGIEGRGVTSIAKVLEKDPPSIDEVASVVLDKVGEVFGVHLQDGQDLK